jgi:hypothetical protein
VRQVALHRIKAAHVLPRRALRPENFNLEAYIGEGAFFYPVSGERIRLRALFDPGAAENLHETPLAADQKLTSLTRSSTRQLWKCLKTLALCDNVLSGGPFHQVPIKYAPTFQVIGNAWLARKSTIFVARFLRYPSSTFNSRDPEQPKLGRIA